MKIGIFTDARYATKGAVGNRIYDQSKRKIKEAYEFFEDEKCQLVISLGNLIEPEDDHALEVSNLKAIAEILSASPIPTVCLMGERDKAAFTKREFYSTLGISEARDFNIGGRSFVILDTCLASDDSDSYVIPDTEELSEVLDSLDGDSFVLIHHGIDPELPEEYRILNADEIFSMISSTAAVKAVFQGNLPTGKISEYDGVRYYAPPAMCEGEDRSFVFEI